MAESIYEPLYHRMTKGLSYSTTTDDEGVKVTHFTTNKYPERMFIFEWSDHLGEHKKYAVGVTTHLVANKSLRLNEHEDEEVQYGFIPKYVEEIVIETTPNSIEYCLSVVEFCRQQLLEAQKVCRPF